MKKIFLFLSVSFILHVLLLGTFTPNNIDTDFNKKILVELNLNSSTEEFEKKRSEIKTVVIDSKFKPKDYIEFSSKKNVNAFRQKRFQKYIKKKNREVTKKRAEEFFKRRNVPNSINQIINLLQVRYPNGKNLICYSNKNFQCTPQNAEITQFINSKWSLLKYNFLYLPHTEITRKSGVWSTLKIGF